MPTFAEPSLLAAKIASCGKPEGAVCELAAAASLLAVTSCNEVVTQAPLFSRGDAAGAPPFRSGVWRELAGAKCVFDARKPVTGWPACAQGFLIIDGTFAAYEVKGGHRSLTPVGDVLLVGGPTMILQFGPGMGEPGPSTPGDKTYSYAGARVTKRDDRGQIVAFDWWTVECGPPPPKDAKKPDGSSGRAGTVDPLPDMTMDKDGDNCTTTSPQAVRDAAAASEKWVTPDSFAWVRDGDL